MADKLTASQIYTLLLRGGFSRDDAVTMTAIAQAESARDPMAVGDVGLQNGTWGPSVGLFQIRTLKAETGTGSDRDIEKLTGNPQAQVEAALNISGQGRNFRPWSTYTSGSYKKFLDTPLREDASLPRSGGGQAAEAGRAAEPAGADPFEMDRGRPPIKVADKDGDGLTDRFEKMLGTDARDGDTDGDGLSDAFETSSSHTDPRSEDTDRDGVTDDAELSAGGDAGRHELPEAARKAGFGGLDSLDSDRDGLSDGYERQHRSDPFAADSDRDGFDDGDEAAAGTDPRGVDSNRDGLSDGFAAAHGLPTAAPSPGAGELEDLDLPH